MHQRIKIKKKNNTKLNCGAHRSVEISQNTTAIKRKMIKFRKRLNF